MSTSNVKGRRSNYNNHVLHSGDKSIANNAEKYNTAMAQRQAIGHNFILVGSHTYKNVTQAEIALRESYAKSLISNFTGQKIIHIDLARMDYSYSTSRKTEVFSIHTSGRGWGKVAITTTTVGDYRTLQFVIFKRVSKRKDGKDPRIVHSDTRKRKGNWTK